MGEEVDYWVEQATAEDRNFVAFIKEWEGNFESRLWTCKDGTKIKIADMSKGHLWSCIRLLERRNELKYNYFTHKWIEKLRKEWRRRYDTD